MSQAIAAKLEDSGIDPMTLMIIDGVPNLLNIRSRMLGNRDLAKARTSAFMEGIHLGRDESLTSPIALMCSEKDPANYHRALLAGHHLDNLARDARHNLPGQPDPQTIPPSWSES